MNNEQVHPMTILGPSISSLNSDSLDPILDLIQNLNHQETYNHPPPQVIDTVEEHLTADGHHIRKEIHKKDNVEVVKITSDDKSKIPGAPKPGES